MVDATKARRAAKGKTTATPAAAHQGTTQAPAAPVSQSAHAVRVRIPNDASERYMQDLEAAVRVASLETDRDEAFPVAYALDVVEDRLLPSLRSRLAAVDFTRVPGGYDEAENKAACDVFAIQALVILAANAKGGRPDLARIVLHHLQLLANLAVPACAEADEPPDPAEWLALPGDSLTACRAQPAAVPDPAAPQPDAFRRGMDLALAMMRQADELPDVEAASARRRHRNGKPQVRFAERHLRNLVANPELIEGFAAVLSAGLIGDLEGCPCLPDWQDVPAAEYMPGRPGDDGTEAENDEQPKPSERLRMQAGPAPTQAPLTGTVRLLSEIAQDLAQLGQSDAHESMGPVHAAARLAEYLRDDLERAAGLASDAHEAPSLEQVSARLHELSALLECLGQVRSVDDLKTARDLVAIAKGYVDKVVELWPGEVYGQYAGPYAMSSAAPAARCSART